MKSIILQVVKVQKIYENLCNTNEVTFKEISLQMNSNIFRNVVFVK